MGMELSPATCLHRAKLVRLLYIYQKERDRRDVWSVG